jgi:hypothetical protein
MAEWDGSLTATSAIAELQRGSVSCRRRIAQRHHTIASLPPLTVPLAPGKHAFIGVGFNSRSDAFDFNVALADWQKQAEVEAEGAEGLLDLGPAGQDFSLKAGEKLNIKVSGWVA